MGKIIKLGDYKDKKIKVTAQSVTDEEVETEIGWMMVQMSQWEKVDRAAELGDQAVIDYKGSVDGEYFDGGADEKYPLELGAGQFIPGFEDQLVGAKAGDSVNVVVTFPEQYPAPNLAGKEAVFECFVHEVRAKETKKFDDEFAREYLAVDSADAYRSELKSSMIEQKMRADMENAEKEILEGLYGSSEVEITDEEIDEETKTIFADLHNRLLAQGASFEDYLKGIGKTVEELTAELRPTVIERIKYMSVIQEVANIEGITVSDDELDEEIDKLAAKHGATADQLKEMLGANVEMLRANTRLDKTVQFLKDICIVLE